MILVGQQKSVFGLLLQLNRRHLLRVHPHPALERLVHNARPGLLWLPAQRRVQRVQEPREERDRVALLRNLERLLGAEHDGLEHLVRRDVGLEVARVPELAEQLAEPLGQERHDVAGRLLDARVVFLAQEVVAERADVRQRLDEEEQEKKRTLTQAIEHWTIDTDMIYFPRPPILRVTILNSFIPFSSAVPFWAKWS